MGDDQPTLQTRVGRADWGENHFFGHRVCAELCGEDGFWSQVSLAVGGPRLGADLAAVLDDVSMCVNCADPRIWPLKLARVMSSYGRMSTAFAVGPLFFEDGLIGPFSVRAAAEHLVHLRAERERSPQALEAALEAAVWSIRARDAKIWGYGLHRDAKVDERVDALSRCVERHGRADGPYWRTLLAAHDVIRARYDIPINIAGAAAAVCLDLGYTPRQLAGLAFFFFTPMFLAHAMEGSAQAPEVLRRLPDEAIAYEGRPPRPSPRASSTWGDR